LVDVRNGGAVRWRCGMNFVVVVTAALAFVYLIYVILQPEQF
jgi:K+-transporting ATPase KdpF subunit